MQRLTRLVGNILTVNEWMFTRVFGNAQTLSWTSGEAICAVYIYEKENYQKTRGQNSKF